MDCFLKKKGWPVAASIQVVRLARLAAERITLSPDCVQQLVSGSKPGCE